VQLIAHPKFTGLSKIHEFLAYFSLSVEIMNKQLKSRLVIVGEINVSQVIKLLPTLKFLSIELLHIVRYFQTN
jgi:hypothetical protein